MNRVEVISKAGEFDVRDFQFIKNELLDVWDHHSFKPHPDSSSIPMHSCAETLLAESMKDPKWAALFEAERKKLDAEETSSSISTEQTFEEAWREVYPSLYDTTSTINRALKEVGGKMWAAAKGSTEVEGK
jgi:hypothetical protein